MSIVEQAKGKVFNVLGSPQVTKVKRLFLPASARRHAIVGSARLWKMKRQFQHDFLVGVGLDPGSYLLDFGCGTLRGGIPLIQFLEKGHYTGVDVRPEAMAEALKELDEQALAHKEPVLLYVRDPAQLALEQRYDIIWAFSVLIHLSDDHLRGALAFTSHHLTEDGSLFANVNIGDRPDGKWDLFPVVERSVDFYREQAAAVGLEIEDLGPIAALGHNSGVDSHDNGHMLRFHRTSGAAG